MLRKASIMYVNPSDFDEYQRRHDELWPEMVAELKKHGAHHYSIFLHRPTGQLFSYLEIESEEKWSEMANTEICQRWWKYMEPLMVTHLDASPISEDLDQVFYLD